MFILTPINEMIKNCPKVRSDRVGSGLGIWDLKVLKKIMTFFFIHPMRLKPFRSLLFT